MALGGTNQSAPQLAPINPANLIGLADPSIVEPRATAILTDAFRQGVVTADDIMSRIGEGAQAKKKAELQMAQEFTSPEAQAAREQQLATQTAQGQVAQAQAERAKIIAQYPAVDYFDKLAAKAGIAEPKKEDGTPDYKEMEKIGLELALDTSKKLTAMDERKNIDAHFDADNQVVRAFTKQGAPVDPGRVRELDRTINSPFSRQAPGSTVTSATPAPVVEARGTPAVAATAPPPAVVPPGALPFGTPTAGGYAMGGTPKPPPAAKTSTMEQDKANLALSRFAESQNIQDALKTAGYDPTSYGSWFNSILPQVFKSGNQKMYETAQQAWAQGLLRLESGAAISVPEQAWYSKTFFPAVNDPPALVQAKEGLRANVERTMAEIAQKGGVISPEAVRNAALLAQKDSAVAATPGAAASTAPVKVNSPAEAPPTAQFIQAPDGRVFKNPNYRP